MGIRASSSEFPAQEFAIDINFDCDPANADKLKAIVFEEIDNMVKEGPSQVNLDKAKENFLKNRENAMKENGFWLNTIVFDLKHNDNTLDTENYNEQVNAISVKKVQKLAKLLFSQENIIEIVMKPL